MEFQRKVKVELCIMTHDRVDFLFHSVRSCLNQNYPNENIDLTIYVSNNSKSDVVDKFISLNYPKLLFVKRVGLENVIDHHKAIIDDCDADYLIMFHDDDVMNEDFVKVSVNFLQNFDEVAAVGLNAVVIDSDGRRIGGKIFRSKNVMFMDNPLKVIERFLGYSSIGLVPFSSYVYRMEKIKSQEISYEDAGFHSDVSFIANLSRKTIVAWLPQVCMSIRRHEFNGHIIMRQRARFVRYVLRVASEYGVDVSRLVKRYRISYLYKRITSSRSRGSFGLRKKIKYTHLINRIKAFI